jgi:aspartyl aminopeptidase
MPPLVRTFSQVYRKMQDSYLPLAQEAVAYLNRSTDPFHAVQASIDLLEAAGYQPLRDVSSGGFHVESSAAATKLLQPGGKYYYTRNRSTLVAFRVGQAFCTSRGGLVVIGGHTDSPNLRIKPRSKRSNTAQVIQLGVECYGGGLWHTWFDRDLGISGRVFVRKEATAATSSSADPEEAATTAPDSKIAQKLIQINRPICRISNLAIHLQTAAEREAFAINKEDHLSPILAGEVAKLLTQGGTESGPDTAKDEKTGSKDGWAEFQEPVLLQLLATELGLASTQDIVDFELNLFDVQQATTGGAHHEFIFSARLDNLASCFLAVKALLAHTAATEEKQLANDCDVSMIVLYDHEEVGSESAVGAASPM